MDAPYSPNSQEQCLGRLSNTAQVRVGMHKSAEGIETFCIHIFLGKRYRPSASYFDADRLHGVHHDEVHRQLAACIHDEVHMYIAACIMIS